MSKDDLGNRIKNNYESISDARLTRRTPCILRVDGRAFSSLTSTMKKPWDTDFSACMWAAALALVEEIQGAKTAFCQSDEISVLITDYDTLQTSAWFDYRVQKMCSIAGSIATLAFTEKFRTAFPHLNKRPAFDCRVFSIPREEVTNYFIWRENDASRNSVSMLAQAHFSHKELQGMSCSKMQDMLMTFAGTNWNDQPIPFKRGVCCVKKTFLETLPDQNTVFERSRWVVDQEIPIFSQDRDYIERYVNIDRNNELTRSND